MRAHGRLPVWAVVLVVLIGAACAPAVKAVDTMRAQPGDAAAAVDAPVTVATDSSTSGSSAAGDALDATAPSAPPCPMGKHSCAGTCVTDDDVLTCGTSCQPCPHAQRGRETCDGKKCGVVCPPGFNLCLDRCIPQFASCSETCGFTGTSPVTCGFHCVTDTPNSCCSIKGACGAYACRDNRCITSCKSSADCAAGQTCDASTGECGPCGNNGQFCCWEVAGQVYECKGDDVYCGPDMKCLPVPR